MFVLNSMNSQKNHVKIGCLCCKLHIHTVLCTKIMNLNEHWTQNERSSEVTWTLHLRQKTKNINFWQRTIITTFKSVNKNKYSSFYQIFYFNAKKRDLNFNFIRLTFSNNLIRFEIHSQRFIHTQENWKEKQLHDQKSRPYFPVCMNTYNPFYISLLYSCLVVYSIVSLLLFSLGYELIHSL